MDVDAEIQGKLQRQLPRLRLAVGVGGLLCIIALLTLPSFAPWLTRVDYWTADWRTAFLSRSDASQHAQIAVVVINDVGLNGSAVGGARRWGRAGQSWWGSLLGPAA